VEKKQTELVPGETTGFSGYPKLCLLLGLKTFTAQATLAEHQKLVKREY
jgi:hypothetical protein